MKKYNIIYWVTTGILFLFEGVMPALTSQSEMAKEGIRHLGYPEYFGAALAVFKVLGSIILILPQAKGRIKEWAYAGFTFNILFAAISNTAVDGLGFGTVFPLIIGVILALSYWSYHKRQQRSVVA